MTAPTSRPSDRPDWRPVARIWAWLSWPVGLVLVLVHTMGGGLPTAVFVVLDVA